MAQALIFFRPLDGLRGSFARVKTRTEALWRAYPRETVGLGVLGIITAAAIAGSAHSTPELSAGAAAAPPPPPPPLDRPPAPQQAPAGKPQGPRPPGAHPPPFAI